MIGDHWKSLDIIRDRWRSLEINGKIEDKGANWRSFETLGDHSWSLEIIRSKVNNWMEWDIIGDHWRSLEIIGDHLIIRDFWMEW